MTDVRRLSRRSKAAITSLGAVALTDVAAIAASVPYLGYLRSLDPRSVTAELDLVTSELAYSLMGLAQLVACIVAAVFFIRWFYLVHANLRRFSDDPTTYTSRWTFWGFVIPFLNLIRPQQVMREVWTHTSRQWKANPARVVGLQQPRDRVNVWWGYFLLTCILGNIVGRISLKAITAQETLMATWATLATDAIDIAAVIAAVALIISVTELQRPLLGPAPSITAA